ncbi:MAG: hypothetical protein JWR21_4201 [Herminiimonas sp.]|nr:hypothetical protein [Herminiimonas sp.]
MTSTPRDIGIPVLTEIIDLAAPSPASAERAATEVPTVSEVHDVPTLSEVAEVPTLSEVAEVPTLSEVPEVPTLSEVAEGPTYSEVTDVPTLSDVAEVPTLSEVPEVPSPPEVAGVPTLSELPELSTPSETPQVSTLSALPSAPTVHSHGEAAPPSSSMQVPANVLARRAKPLFPTRANQAPPAVRVPTLQSAEEAEAEAVATWTPEQWNRMELALRERILNQILLHVDAVLDAKVRDALADVLQASVTRMADDLRASLRVSLADTIERAVEQEISRLQNSK